MGQSMVGRLAIKAKQIKPGDAFAAVVPAGGLVEIVDLDGKQVAELVAFDHADPSEHLSLGVTRQQSKSIMLSLGMTLYSSRGRSMLDLVEDTVGRHDILWAAPTVTVEPAKELAALVEPETTAEDGVSDPASVEIPSSETTIHDVVPAQTSDATETSVDGSNTEPLNASGADTKNEDSAPEDRNDTDHMALVNPEPGRDPLTGFSAALAQFGLGETDAPDPVNFFMQLAVMQRGDLELRAPMSERGDRVVLKALTDLIVAVRCSAAEDETNGEKPSDILVRVYR